MKTLLILIFSLFSVIACVKSDTTTREIAPGIEIEPRREITYNSRKPKSKIKSKPKPKFGYNAAFINHQDLTETQINEAIFIIENQSYIRIDSVLYKVDFKDRIYKIVEQMPMFPACDSLTNYELRKPCADQAMLKFIYERVKYPTISREGGVEGMTVVSFIVEKDGSISRLKVVRDIGAGCGEEAMRVVNLFPKFEPAKIDGKPVRVQFHLPIRFRLE